jgi:hypothetical protein
MRCKVLWNLLVALFVCGLLLPSLSARAGEGTPGAGKTPVVKQPIAPAAPESESGAVMPGEAEGFNPQPEPPAAEIKPGLKQPIRKKGMEPGDDERAMEPGDDEKLVLPPGKKGMDPVDK